jgi:hypothetical protein
METKICPKCGETKGVGEFHRQQKNADGIQSRCKACQVLASREHYAKNANRIRARRREQRADMGHDP